MDFYKIREEVELGQGTQFDPFVAQTVLNNWHYIVEQVHRKNMEPKKDPIELVSVTKES